MQEQAKEEMWREGIRTGRRGRSRRVRRDEARSRSGFLMSWSWEIGEKKEESVNSRVRSRSQGTREENAPRSKVMEFDPTPPIIDPW